MDIEFDPDKDSANQEKHGVSLAFGIEILSDANRLDILDVRVGYAEERFIADGLVAGRVWLCVFTRRGNRYRMISVRKSHDRETRRDHSTAR
jgi:uncharacterized DUF497 family protein